MKDVINRIADFASRGRVQVTIKSMDGYEIIARPGKTPVVLPPAEHSAATTSE